MFIVQQQGQRSNIKATLTLHYVSVYITVKLGVAGASLSEPHTDHMYGDLSVSDVRPFGPR